MMLQHQMHHRLQVQQVRRQVTPDDEQDKMNSHKSHLETSLLSLTQFVSSPKQKISVRFVNVSLTFKTRLKITEGCSQSLMTRPVRGLDFTKTKCNKSRTRSQLLNIH